jgi:hypothetical protein
MISNSLPGPRLARNLVFHLLLLSKLGTESLSGTTETDRQYLQSLGISRHLHGTFTPAVVVLRRPMSPVPVEL